MSTAFVRLNRKYFNDFLWKEKRVFSKAEAWLDLIRSARFEASNELINGHVIEIQRGEMPASRRYLEQRWQWGSSKVTSFLKTLIKLDRINQRVTNGQTVYMLVNYDLYNGSHTINAPPTEPAANQGRPKFKESKEGKGKSKYNAKQYLINLLVTENQADNWLHYRRVVKHASVSKLVVDNINNVAQQANMTLAEALELQEKNNWQGFKIEWITNTYNNERTTTLTPGHSKQRRTHDNFISEVDNAG